jgi:hypothetical protein
MSETIIFLRGFKLDRTKEIELVGFKEPTSRAA